MLRTSSTPGDRAQLLLVIADNGSVRTVSAKVSAHPEFFSRMAAQLAQGSCLAGIPYQKDQCRAELRLAERHPEDSSFLFRAVCTLISGLQEDLVYRYSGQLSHSVRPDWPEGSWAAFRFDPEARTERRVQRHPLEHVVSYMDAPIPPWLREFHEAYQRDEDFEGLRLRDLSVVEARRYRHEHRLEWPLLSDSLLSQLDSLLEFGGYLASHEHRKLIRLLPPALLFGAFLLDEGSMRIEVTARANTDDEIADLMERNIRPVWIPTDLAEIHRIQGSLPYMVMTHDLVDVKRMSGWPTEIRTDLIPKLSRTVAEAALRLQDPFYTETYVAKLREKVVDSYLPKMQGDRQKPLDRYCQGLYQTLLHAHDPQGKRQRSDDKEKREAENQKQFAAVWYQVVKERLGDKTDFLRVFEEKICRPYGLVSA